MRHLAWLGAVPQPKKPKRLQDAANDDQRSRIQKLQADGAEPSMPPCRSMYLVNLLMEVGPVEAAGVEMGVISWSAIQHYQEATCSRLEPWMARLLRRLSTDYLVESRLARDEDCPPPWGAITQDQRVVVDQKMRSVFGGLVARMMNRQTKGGRS